MPNNTKQTIHDSVPRLTITIDGPYFPLEKFRRVLDNFLTVLSEIDKEISDTGETGVEWSISEVRQGSICLTAEANVISDKIELERPYEVIETFKAGLETVKESPKRPQNFTDRALKNIKNISNLINPNDFAEISFSDTQWKLYLTQNISVNIDEITQNFYKIYGSIEGKLISISVAQRQNMGIRSSTEKKVIRCFFPDELFDQARDALGKRVYVFGLIRQYLHGEKINIQVQELKVFPEKTESLAEILSFMRGAT